MKHTLLSIAVAALTAGTGCVTFAAAPVVSNIRAALLAGTKNVEVLYDVGDADGDALTIGLEISGDGGLSYAIPATALSGNVGSGVAPGLNRRIVWNAGTDWNNQYVPNARARVTAYDGTTPVPPVGMVYIPAGNFQMGDNLDGLTDAMPVHNVALNVFFMDRFEVAKELWQTVQTWSNGRGYSISGGSFKAVGHPVQSITWYDAVKWCNARSEKEGLTPCYYTDDAQTLVYRTGNVNVTNAQVKWSANGYRLPTEAEWEKAARGGSLGLRFPWGNTAAHTQANYYAQPGSYSYDVNATTGYHPTYATGGQPYTNPVGAFAPNAYDLYDMAGNVWEWCWNLYGGTYYSDVAASNNPRGPTTGTNRVLRGGAWNLDTLYLRCAQRISLGSLGSYSYCGFRCVRGL